MILDGLQEPLFNKGPQWMACLEVPVCGQSISYSDLASKLAAVTGLKAEYGQCSVEAFEERSGNDQEKRKELKALRQWLADAQDNRVRYGTVEMSLFITAEKELGRKALLWENFLERTRWRGPPRKVQTLS
jgi:hypothetical protein